LPPLIPGAPGFGLLVQVLAPPLLRALCGMEDNQQPDWFVADVAPAVGLLDQKEEAVPRLQLVGLACDPVFDLAFEAEDKLLAQMGNRLGPCTGARFQRDQERLHPLVSQPCCQILHPDLVALGLPAAVLPGSTRSSAPRRG